MRVCVWELIYSLKLYEERVKRKVSQLVRGFKPI